MSKRSPTSAYTPDLAELRVWLEQMIATMRFVELVIAIIGLIGRMRDINAQLLARVAHLTRKRPRSETLERLERQLLLPLEGLVAPKAKRKKDPGPASQNQRRGGGGRGKFPKHIPRIPVPNPVSPDLRVCPLCGAEMNTVSHSVCEMINVIPARLIIEQRVDETVACPNDDTIVSAAPPGAIVERGKLGDTLIVEATCDKYIEHQPIERQCTRFGRAGVEITPQTLGRSVNAHIELLRPIAQLIVERTRAPGYLGTDATGIPILDRSVTEGIRSGTMWCWTNACWVSFFYAARGDTQSVRDFLDDDLCRVVQCDGTSVTNCIERAGGKRPGCMAHGRRGLVEAARGGDAIALDGLRLIKPLFEIERASKLAGDTAEQRLARRREHSQPVVDALRAWIDEHRDITPPKTPLGRALGYLDRQWKRLTLFLEDGNIALTNNRRERELRRLVLGRKNWLFTWLDDGGNRTADILTIIATCIAHEVNPRAYLHLVTKLIVRGFPQSKLRDLLPDRMLAAYPELHAGDPATLPDYVVPPALPA
ncbi:MAG: IS66 family transposase [Myxococcales bacterium]|nr:IS66 family transposase [Myxococcales bacterium]MCB9576799.1 IS66 family transposase [Polyangiaceae bacterium]